MSMLVWVMMGIAVWHFTIFLPDRFRGGIVGAFLMAVAASAVFGFLVSGLTVPGRNDTDLVEAVWGAVGAVIGLAISWFWGDRIEPQRPEVL